MDMKLKIIFAVFVIVVVLYFMQFMIDFMKKKAHLSNRYFDDVEHYEDAPETTKASPSAMEPYKIRLFLLEEIDKLKIEDKNVKGAVMECLFSETTMKEFDKLPDNKDSRDKMAAKVKECQASILNTTASTPAEAPKAPAAEPPKSPAAEPPKAPAAEPQKAPAAEPAKAPVTEAVKAFFANPEGNNELKAKVNKASEKLDAVIDNLQDMKRLLSDGNEKEEYVPPYPKLPERSPLIEGFENIRAYATF